MTRFEPVSKSTLVEADASYADFFANPGSRFDRGGLLPLLQIFAPQPDGSAPYIFCGDQSTTAELYGSGLAKALLGKSQLPNVESDFLRFVDEDFHRVARDRGYSFARVELKLTGSPGAVTKISFWRLVFPFDTGCGTAVGSLTRFCAGGRPRTFAVDQARS